MNDGASTLVYLSLFSSTPHIGPNRPTKEY